jgi:hypothetical protein
MITVHQEKIGEFCFDIKKLTGTVIDYIIITIFSSGWITIVQSSLAAPGQELEQDEKAETEAMTS